MEYFSVVVLGNMNIIKKRRVAQLVVGLRIRNLKTAYIDDFPSISNMDNPKVIQEYINMAREEAGVILTIDEILEAPDGSVYKPSRKKKQVAFEAEKVVHKPPKKKVIRQKEVQKEVKEVDYTTILIPTKKRSEVTGKTPQKTTSYDMMVVFVKKKKKLRKMVLQPEEEEEYEDQPLVRRNMLWKK